MSRGFQVLIALCMAIGMAAACGGSGQPAGRASSGTPPPPGVGSVSGRIVFEGTAPEPRVIRMASDPMCVRDGQPVTSEVLVVGPDSGLKNVFVYVKDGLGDWTYPVPTSPVVLDQDGCRYDPHVRTHGSHGAVPLRRARVDERVRGRAAAPVLLDEPR
jgi:hypothetical protein